MALLKSQAITPAFLIQRYGLLATLVKPKTIKRIVRDDDVVIATALTAQADMIVTGDQDLLVLHPCEDIPILDTRAALQHLKKHCN